jgi:hypothetical protein
MSNFKGKNSRKSVRDQMIYKSRFNTQAYVEEGPEVVDFNFIEYNLYGTIDLSGSSIYPEETRIINFKSNRDDPQTFRAFDFVTRMFQDVKTNIQAAISMGEMFSDNQIITNMEIKRAYEPPKKEYRTYLSNILINYNKLLNNNKRLTNNITRFDHYVKELFVFLLEGYSNKPMTFSGWLQSSNNSIFSTGLALSISDIPFDDDDRKYEEFMSSSMFEYYKKICLNRGFSIAKHCPYVLVADIGSPAIVPYINDSIYNIINNNYNNSYIIDNIILKNKLIEYYNFFLLENPYKVKLEFCRKKTSKKIIYRKEYSESYSDEYWNGLYLTLRNLELGNIKGDSELRKIKKYLKNMKNTLDNFELIGYIDSSFRNETFKKSYGFLDLVRRMDEKRKMKDKQEGITKGSTILGGSGGGTAGGY